MSHRNSLNFQRWPSQDRYFNSFDFNSDFGNSDHTFTYQEDTHTSPHTYTKRGAWVTFNNM